MKSILIVLFTLFCLSSFAQQIIFKCVLYNESNGLIVPNLEMTLNKKNYSCDSNGTFEIMVDAGIAHELIIKNENFKPFVRKFLIKKDTTLSVFLVPNQIQLDEVTVTTEKDNNFGISRLNNVEGTTIYAGKKSEAIYVQDLNANLAANSSRQVFAKIPGINVFENDGTGTTIGIGGRGLNPNRISNFNTRQNGYDISADALGYPESYYTPPTEAIERIEILRGAAALQFGTQFGGMINYKFIRPPENKKMSGDFRQTNGSYGFYNAFNKLSGTHKKISYTTFYQYKTYQGWRKNSQLNSHNAFASISYQATKKLQLNAEYTFLNYLAQQPGGLTDRQFLNDVSIVTRSRNWFKVNWNLISVSANYAINETSKLNINAFGLIASRDALGFLGRTDRPDLSGTNRNLLSDIYQNYGSEVRYLKRYALFKKNSHFLVGARYYKGQTTRKQGSADDSNQANFNFLYPNNLDHSSYVFPSHNKALFFENIFQLTSKWSVTPGLRLEHINTQSEGYYRLLNKNLTGDTLLDSRINDKRSNERNFLLGGIGTQYKLIQAIEFYANFCQNYRSINFNDMRVVNPNFQVDPNLKDENGYTIDGGVRGALKNLLYYDVSIYLLRYNQRIGTTLGVDTNTYQIIRYRTNLGNSKTIGLEAFAEIDWIKLCNKNSHHKFATFVNYSLTKATYINSNKAIEGNTVEYVPKQILRTGITYTYKKFTVNTQYAYTGAQFSDATNSAESSSGIFGLIPSYRIIDASMAYTYKIVTLSFGVNNLGNTKYFTRRAEGYPGPGIIPADPINYYIILKVLF